MVDYQKQIDEALRLVEETTVLLKGSSVDPGHLKITQNMVSRYNTLQLMINDFSKRAAAVGVGDFTASVDGTLLKVGEFLEQSPAEIAADWATAGGEMASVEQWAIINESALVFVEGIPTQVVFIQEQLHKRLQANGPTLIANMDALKREIARVLADLDPSVTYSRETLAGSLKAGLLETLGCGGPPPRDKEGAAKRARLEGWAGTATPMSWRRGLCRSRFRSPSRQGASSGRLRAADIPAFWKQSASAWRSPHQWSCRPFETP